jgi:hypothetical protein
VPIVAMNAGNSAGAKGRQFEIENRGNMPRHRADYAHDHTTYSLHTMNGHEKPLSHAIPRRWGYIFTIVDDSSWEPDGVTLQVRFCEGGML